MHRAATRPTPQAPSGTGNKSVSSIYGSHHAPAAANPARTDSTGQHGRARGPLGNSPSAGRHNERRAGGRGEAAPKPKHAAGFAGRQSPVGPRPPGHGAAAAAAPTEADDEPFVPEMEEEGPATQGDHLMFAKAKRQASSSGRSFFGDDEATDGA